MNANIACKLPILATELGEKKAVTFGGMKPDSKGNFHYQSLSFAQLERRSRFFAHKLREMGLTPGMKVLVFVRPSVDFSALTFALFRAGLVPIFIDPGMGKENLLRAVEHIAPDGLIAEKQVHWLRLIYRKAFSSVKCHVTVSGLTWGKMQSVAKWKAKEVETDDLMHQCAPEDSAAILFTSGGTGIPKGVRYTHDIFNAQVDRLQKLFNLGPDEVDLPGFPLFSLFTITMGMTSAIPSMDPSRPGLANAEYLVKNINDHKATFIAGSPAIWKNVSKYCLEKKITLPSVKYLVMFGAPIPLSLHDDFKEILTNGDTYTPYGATECLPVANISGSELSGETRDKMLEGLGTCVGYPAPETTIKIIPITDQIIKTSNEMGELPQGQLGEICILSRTVTPEYVGMPKKTAEAKIQDESGKLWHRMGDIGYLDKEGRLWFCGRKSHRIHAHSKIIPTIPIESLINQNSKIQKSALVGPEINGKVLPTLVIESSVNDHQQEVLRNEIREKIKSDERLKDIEDIRFMDHFPVDVRHNIKIDRLKIRDLAQKGALK